MTHYWNCITLGKQCSGISRPSHKVSGTWSKFEKLNENRQKSHFHQAVWLRTRSQFLYRSANAMLVSIARPSQSVNTRTGMVMYYMYGNGRYACWHYGISMPVGERFVSVALWDMSGREHYVHWSWICSLAHLILSGIYLGFLFFTAQFPFRLVQKTKRSLKITKWKHPSKSKTSKGNTGENICSFGFEVDLITKKERVSEVTDINYCHHERQM